MQSEFSVTKDGSLTFYDFSEHASYSGESMHSSSGALGESLHVYLPCFNEAIEHALIKNLDTQQIRQVSQIGQIRVCCVGLGLGYLEMISAASFLSKGLDQCFNESPLKLFLFSYESNPTHVQALQKWLKGEASSLHSQICENVAARFALSKHSLQSFLKQLFEARQWNFEGELSQDLLQLKAKNGISESAKYHVIYFDAYSSKSSPFLWQEDFLCSFLKLHANENSCCFASYASRSSLKRALKEQKFRLVKRKGFMQKRECTFALRSHLR